MKSILMTAQAPSVITTALVSTLSITTPAVVDQGGLADCAISSWGHYAIRLITITLMSVRMGAFVVILLTKTTTRVLVILASLVGTVSLKLILVTALRVNKVELARSLVLMTSNVTVH